MYSQRWSHNDLWVIHIMPLMCSKSLMTSLLMENKSQIVYFFGPQSLLWYGTSLFSDCNAHSPSSHSIYLLYRDLFAIFFPYKTHCSFILYSCCSFCLDIYACHGVQQKNDDTLKIKWGMFLGTNFKVGERNTAAEVKKFTIFSFPTNWLNYIINI